MTKQTVNSKKLKDKTYANNLQAMQVKI